MARPTFALLALVLAASPAAALELVEMKDGRVYQAKEVVFEGDRLRLVLDTHGTQVIELGVPIDKVLPEAVYYAWRDSLLEGDADGRLALAEWARAQGLFGRAREQYEAAAAARPSLQAELDAIFRAMHDEEATWLFDRAWEQFRADRLARSRELAERIILRFPDSIEVQRSKGLLSILAEREAFLTEAKRLEEIAERARKQRREVEKRVALIDRAELVASRIDYGSPGDAASRLEWAAAAYRAALATFRRLLPEVEVDDLRLSLEALMGDAEARLQRTFLALADLRFLVGDSAGALQAVHEVLALDPGSEPAQTLRKKILDTAYEPAPATYPVYVYPRFRHRFHLGPCYRTQFIGFGHSAIITLR